MEVDFLAWASGGEVHDEPIDVVWLGPLWMAPKASRPCLVSIAMANFHALAVRRGQRLAGSVRFHLRGA